MEAHHIGSGVGACRHKKYPLRRAVAGHDARSPFASDMRVPWGSV